MGYLRTLLALSVVFAHSPWNNGFVFVGGRNAVELFYIISGFLITHAIRTNDSYRNPLIFFANRALRIYPIYYAVAALTLLALAFGSPKFLTFWQSLGSEARWVLGISNLLIFGQDWIMFLTQEGRDLHFTANFHESALPLNAGLVVPQAWTLGLELTFYCLAPFVTRSSAKIWTLLFLSVLVCVYLQYIGIASRDPWSYRFFPAELSMFLLGSITNVYLLPVWQKLVKRAPSRSKYPAAATWTLAAIICTYFLLPFDETLRSKFLFAIFTVLMPAAFIHQTTSTTDGAIGELSYPIYIGHMLAVNSFLVVSRSLDLNIGFGVASIVNIVVSIGFAFILNKLVGKPIERLRDRVRKSSNKAHLPVFQAERLGRSAQLTLGVGNLPTATNSTMTKDMTKD